jgi:hypothetical protein
MWHDVWHEQEIFEIVDQIIPWIMHRVEKRNTKLKDNEMKKATFWALIDLFWGRIILFNEFIEYYNYSLISYHWYHAVWSYESYFEHHVVKDELSQAEIVKKYFWFLQ